MSYDTALYEKCDNWICEWCRQIWYDKKQFEEHQKECLANPNINQEVNKNDNGMDKKLS